MLSHHCVKSGRGYRRARSWDRFFFLLYVNDLPDLIDSECRLFADDTLLFNSRTNMAVLQKDLMTLQKYANDWQLSFNVTKCAVLSIGEKKSEIDYFLCEQRLKNVDTHPYLGLELQSNIKWEAHYDKIISKATRILFMLRRVLKHADTKTRKIAYFFFSETHSGTRLYSVGSLFK